MRSDVQQATQTTSAPTAGPTGSRRRSRLLAAAAAGVAALGFLPAVAGSAQAATLPSAPTTSAAATSDPFYKAPSPLAAAAPGTLIRSRPLAIGNTPSPTYRGWSVMYHSRDTHGRDIAVTGSVFTPSAPWTGSGPRPQVAFGVGTQGLGQQCAPSRQFAAGSEYESGNIVAALAKGWSVSVTDYEGYVDGATPTYTTGASEAHTVLDIVRASRAVPGAQVSRTAPVGLWGYSQGGGATGWAAALAPRYAPDVHVVGAASGGIPADLKAVGKNLDGSAFSGLLGYSFVGFNAAYPKLADFDSLANDQGRQLAAQLKTECVGDTAAKHGFVHVQDITRDHLTYEQLVALPDEAKVLKLNDLGTGAPAPTVPVLQYHSSNDEVVPLPQALALHQRWCAEGVKASFTVYPGEHLTGDTAGAPGALAFLGSRFAGAPAVSSCSLTG
jgi:hypothetical protein